MLQRACIIGILAGALATGSLHTAPALAHFVSSAHHAQRCFREFERNRDSWNPVERFVFSLVMANAGPDCRT